MRQIIDVEKLRADARRSCCRESFVVVQRSPIIRIGAGARAGDGDDCLLFVEVSLKLCPGKNISSTASLENGVRLAKLLLEMGYDIACEDGHVYFEKAVAGEEMNWELEGVIGAVAEASLVEPAPV